MNRILVLVLILASLLIGCVPTTTSTDISPIYPAVPSPYFSDIGGHYGYIYGNYFYWR